MSALEELRVAIRDGVHSTEKPPLPWLLCLQEVVNNPWPLDEIIKEVNWRYRGQRNYGRTAYRWEALLHWSIPPDYDRLKELESTRIAYGGPGAADGDIAKQAVLAALPRAIEETIREQELTGR